MVILYIDRNDSTCGGCNRGCLPMEPSHVTPSGYDQHPGCGATYTHVSSNYLGEDIARAARAMRPDLIFIDQNKGFLDQNGILL